LYSLAAEASRQAAWAHFDQDNHPAASRCFETALRASATAGDPVTGAYTLSFLAVQCYSTGEARQAISLLETAHDTATHRRKSPHKPSSERQKCPERDSNARPTAGAGIKHPGA